MDGQTFKDSTNDTPTPGQQWSNGRTSRNTITKPRSIQYLDRPISERIRRQRWPEQHCQRHLRTNIRKLDKNQFRQGLTDSTLVDNFANYTLETSRNLIRLIGKALQNVGFNTDYSAMYRHDLLGKRIIVEIWDKKEAEEGIVFIIFQEKNRSSDGRNKPLTNKNTQSVPINDPTLHTIIFIREKKSSYVIRKRPHAHYDIHVIPIFHSFKLSSAKPTTDPTSGINIRETIIITVYHTCSFLLTGHAQQQNHQ